MASSIKSRIDSFINDNELPDDNDFRTKLADFVSGCWSDHFKIVMKDQIPEEKTKKVTKAEKIENPTECQNVEDLRNCTAAVLNSYCKEHGLRIGGNKKEIMDRVWRHIQGENSEDDISPRNKKVTKAGKKNIEKHECYGCTGKGTPCAASATVEFNGQWFCWRHEENAADIIAAKSKSKKELEPKVTSEPKVKSKSKKIPEPEPEPESGSESESDQDQDSELEEEE